jgi:hypothetical protein
MQRNSAWRRRFAEWSAWRLPFKITATGVSSRSNPGGWPTLDNFKSGFVCLAGLNALQDHRYRESHSALTAGGVGPPHGFVCPSDMLFGAFELVGAFETTLWVTKLNDWRCQPARIRKWAQGR